jgi:hypothetical protein
VPVVVPPKAAPPKLLASSAAVVGPLAVTRPGLSMPMPPNDAIGAAAIGATAPSALDNTPKPWQHADEPPGWQHGGMPSTGLAKAPERPVQLIIEIEWALSCN